MQLYSQCTIQVTTYTHHFTDKQAGHNGAKLIVIIISANKHRDSLIQALMITKRQLKLFKVDH